MTKCLIFDLDNTLVSDTENIRGAYQNVLKFLNRPYTEDGFQKWLRFDREYWKNSNTILIPSEFQTSTESCAEYLRSMRFYLFFGDTPYMPFELNQIYQDGLYHRIIPLPYAFETVSSLSLKYPIFIATNGVSKVAKYKIEHIGLSQSIQGIFSADMTKNAMNKASLKYFEELLLFMKDYAPHDCMCIGDSYHDDVFNPHQMQFQTVWFHEQEDMIENFVGDYHIRSLKELHRIL